MKELVANNENDDGALRREQSMDVLRIIACMGVIFAHAGAMCFTIDIVEEGTLEWMVCFIIRKVLLLSVPVFALLTGFFFLEPEKTSPLKKLYGKNTLRLVLALVFGLCSMRLLFIQVIILLVA